MSLSLKEREILHAAARIKREKNRERRIRVKAQVSKPSRGRERDNGYLAFLRRQPCRIGLVAPGTCDGPIQACHVRYGDAASGKLNPGMGRKPDDRFATSCCAKHHAEQHSRNERAWWASYGLDGIEEAEKQYAAYRSAA